jgi:FlgD Ig-like domain
MIRGSILSLVTVALACGLAFADPGVETSVEAGMLRVRLEGSYAGATYSVWRSDGSPSPFQSVTNGDVLCTGECFVTDPIPEPGRTYLYRFDLYSPQIGFASFGPFPVTMPRLPLVTRVYPNPAAGAMKVELSLPGGRHDFAVEADARVLDLAGRTVKLLHRGALARGVTTLEWDGRDSQGRPIPTGLYFLHFSSPLGSSTTRILRIR